MDPDEEGRMIPCECTGHVDPYEGRDVNYRADAGTFLCSGCWEAFRTRRDPDGLGCGHCD